jgi:hypothetical protein
MASTFALLKRLRVACDRLRLAGRWADARALASRWTGWSRARRQAARREKHLARKRADSRRRYRVWAARAARQRQAALALASKRQRQEVRDRQRVQAARSASAAVQTHHVRPVHSIEHGIRWEATCGALVVYGGTAREAELRLNQLRRLHAAEGMRC